MLPSYGAYRFLAPLRGSKNSTTFVTPIKKADELLQVQRLQELVLYTTSKCRILNLKEIKLAGNSPSLAARSIDS